MAVVQRLGGMDSRLITFDNVRQSGGWREYPCDLQADDDPERITEVLRAAEMVHYHNSWRDMKLFGKFPWLWDMVKRKPSAIQFHSWQRFQFEDQLRERRLMKLVCAQYHARIYPECIPVPNCVPIDDARHRPARTRNAPPIVVFSPTNTSEKGWNDKGYPETMAVLSRGFRHEVLTRVPWKQVMAKRSGADISIDEIITGSYHMCSLESLSQGLATIAGLDEKTVDALEAVTGTRRHPWIVARPDTLFRELTRLVEDDGYREAARVAARTYMETYWNAGALTRQYSNVYRMALEIQSG
jgi:hypothetical protein